MARPLRINNTTPKSLREMSDAGMNYIAYKVLQSFASSTSGRGTVRVNSGVGTNIGAFIDTARPNAVGTHPVGTTVNSTTYTFYQELSGAESQTGMIRPISWLSGYLKEGSDAQIDADICRRIASIISAGGLASYTLSAGTPAGGTWTQLSAISDTSQTGTSTTRFWRKTGDTAVAAVRPMKWDSALSGVKEMNDSEIATLVKRFRNYIINSGVCQYRAQGTAPVGGTWVQAGAAFTDTRQQVANVNYSGTYTQAYAGAYAGGYAQAYAGSYTQNYAQAYAGGYAQAYVLYYSGRIGGYYTGYFTGYYTNYFAQAYTGYYSQNYTGYYTGYYSSSYTGAYTGLTVKSTKENVSTLKLWVRTA